MELSRQERDAGGGGQLDHGPDCFFVGGVEGVGSHLGGPLRRYLLRTLQRVVADVHPVLLPTHHRLHELSRHQACSEQGYHFLFSLHFSFICLYSRVYLTRIWDQL